MGGKKKGQQRQRRDLQQHVTEEQQRHRILKSRQQEKVLRRRWDVQTTVHPSPGEEFDLPAQHAWPTASCQHIIADDFASGTRVCIACGHVMDVILFGDPGKASHAPQGCHPPPSRPLPNNTTETFPYDTMIREFLYDSLAVIQMNQSYLVDRVIGELYNIAFFRSDTYFYAHLSLRSAKDRGRLAYVVWNTMRAEKCPRAPMEVAILLETTTTHMRAAEKEIGNQPSYSPLVDYVPRLAAELALPHWAVLAVKEACWHAERGLPLIRPEDLVGAVLVELGIILQTHMVGLAHKLTIEDVVDVVGCSAHRLHVLRTKLTGSVRAALVNKVTENTQYHLWSLQHAGCALAQHQADALKKKNDKLERAMQRHEYRQQQREMKKDREQQEASKQQQ